MAQEENRSSVPVFSTGPPEGCCSSLSVLVCVLLVETKTQNINRLIYVLIMTYSRLMDFCLDCKENAEKPRAARNLHKPPKTAAIIRSLWFPAETRAAGLSCNTQNRIEFNLLLGFSSINHLDQQNQARSLCFGLV